LPTFPDSTDGYPRATDWSPDGRLLAITQNGGLGGVWVYSFETRAYRRVADGNDPVWLGDGRRLIDEKRGRLFVADTASGATREVLANAGESMSQPRLAADDSQLFLHARHDRRRHLADALRSEMKNAGLQLCPAEMICLLRKLRLS
jgi:hypothetical protein